jgi:hypothetical protein
MCVKFDLEVRCKKPKKRKDHLIFINFRVKMFTIKNTQKKRTLMFECYYFLDLSHDEEMKFFEVDFQ